MKSRFLMSIIAILSLGHAMSLSAAGAADCFNPRLLQQGVVVEQRYRVKDKLVAGNIIVNSNYSVVGREVFNERNALLVRSEITARTPLGVTTTTQADNYLTLQRSKSRVRNYGGNTTSFVDGVGQGSVDVFFDPPHLLRYDLTEGQRHTQRLMIETSSATPLGPSRSVVQQRITRIYVGQQQLKTPLGTRRACKFRIIEAVTQLGVTNKLVRTEWHDVKSGLVLKEVSGLVTMIMLRGSIDGASI